MGLTRVEFWAVIGIGVVVFLLGAGPVWEAPYAIDGAIVWSYLVVVALGLAILALRRRLSLKSAFLESTSLLLVKFAITLTIAVGFWVLEDPPAMLRAEPKLSQAPRPARVPTLIADADRGALFGTVRRSDGTPLPGALVYVASGLGAFAFDPPKEAISMIHDGRALHPQLAVLEVGQALALETTDGQMHALSGKTESGEIALNLPVVAKGRAKPFIPERELGLIALSCRVHEGELEAPARLLILGHPFHTVTDTQGRYTLTAIPKGRISVRSVTDTAEAEATLELTGPDPALVDLTLGPPSRT